MVSDNLGNEQLTQFLYDSPNTTANVISELGWRSRDNFGNSVQFPSNPLVYPPTLNSGNAAVTSHTYGYGGALTSTTDPNNNQTSYASFMCSGANGNGIYPTTETLANGLQTTLNWDCSTGLSTSATDPNSTQTSKTYDRIGRIFQTTVASMRQTNYNYQEPACTIINGQCIVTAPTPVTITTYRDLNATGDRSVFQTRTLDQRGQVYRTQNNDIFVDTLAKLSDPATARTYEAVSNPYRSTSDSTMGWTRTVYDTMGRPIEVDHFDGATLPYPWGSSNTPSSSSTMVYDGSWTTTTDESGKVKKQHVDGLGRLDTVIEDPAGLNYQTIYTYDVGNNLSGVNQSGQTRTFVYDSLNRLYQATNPESNTTTYTYDPAGNLLTKTDANSVVTTMSYDALNRMTAKSYSNGTSLVTYCWGENPRSGNCATAPVDSSPSHTCHLNLHQVMVTSSVSTTNYSCYDAFEAPTASSQIMGLQTYSFPSYTYNLMGELTSMTYPSGRVVQTVYDSAGRATCVSGGVGTPTCTPSTAYASSITYAPQGAVSGLTLGNGLVETRTFTTRLQLLAISAGSLLNLQYSYAANGNLQSHTTTRGTQSWTDSYSANCYDGVNRLTCGTESGSGTWTLNYGYDTFGNRWLTNNSTTNLPPVTAEVPQTSSWYLTNNRIGNGWGYDNAGNIQSIAGMPRTFSYDGENRQTTATIGTTQTTYGYDGAGRRVTKTVGTATTTYVYDAKGQLAAEYGPAPTITGTWYLSDDALGSTRLMTDAAASATTMRCLDYLPFGEEVLQGYAGRGSCYYGAGYPSSPDVVSQKFTGKERDSETGLDYFEARYYSSAQGRFTSPDEFKGGIVDPFTGQDVETNTALEYADITDPQTLNKYVYVRNNPLRYVDPDGHDLMDAFDVLVGVGRGIASSITYGYVGAPSASDSLGSRTGQAIGTAWVASEGVNLAIGGGTAAVVTAPTIVGAAAGTAVAGAGVALTGGAVKNIAAMSLVKPASGKGSVPPDQRDPKRTLTDSEKAKKLAEQGGNCAHCEQPIKGEKGIAHHDPVRHADGGKDTKVVHKACHDALHSCQ
jgi:RHS repeat-associated protein